MNIVVAKVKNSEYHGTGSSGTFNRSEHIFQEVTGTSQLQEEIAKLQEHSAIARHAQRLVDYGSQPVFKLLANIRADLSETNYRNRFFLESELTILDKQAPLCQMQLRERSHNAHGCLQLNNIQAVGKVFTAIKLGGWSSSYLLITDDTCQVVEDCYLQKPDPAFSMPTERLVKVFGYNLGLTGCLEAVILKLYDCGAKYTTGTGRNYTFDASYVTLPTEQELPIWERKQSIPRQVVVKDNLKELLGGLVNGNDPVAERFWNALQTLEYQGQHGNLYALATNGPDYLMVDPADYTKVTYLDYNKVAGVLEKGNDPWTSTSRVSVSWSKLASKLFLNNLHNARAIEVFHNAATAAATQEFGPEEGKPELLIVRGDDIQTYYNQKMYAEKEKGELGNSCMRYDKCQDFFGIYTENPDKVGLFISRDRKTGKIYGRGLVWEAIDGSKYVDRIYFITEVEKRRMKNWIESQGYEDIWKDRSRHDDLISVQLTLPYQAHYPYMDSMAFLNPDTGMLYNQAQKGTVEMRSQSGGRPKNSNEDYCAATRRIAPKSKMVETISKKHALAAFVKTLRTGGHELEADTVKDELVEGFISKKHVAYVSMKQDEPQLKTLQSNPAICWVTSLAKYMPAADCAYSKLDKSFILKDGAVEMPDGSFCSPKFAEQYKTLLKRRQPNKALLVKAPVEQVAVLA